MPFAYVLFVINFMFYIQTNICRYVVSSEFSSHASHTSTVVFINIMNGELCFAVREEKVYSEER